MGWSDILQRSMGLSSETEADRLYGGGDPDDPASAAATNDFGQSDNAPFLSFLRDLRIEKDDGLSPSEWAAKWDRRLAEQVVRIRDQNRRQRPPASNEINPDRSAKEIDRENKERDKAKNAKNLGYLDQLQKELRRYHTHYVNIAAGAAAFFAVVLLLLRPETFALGFAGHTLSLGDFLTSTAIGVAASTGLAITAIHIAWFFHFSEIRFRARMKEARRRNAARLNHELSVYRRTFLSEAQNEDPEKGPVAFAKMRLLSRLYWDAYYFTQFDFDIFRVLIEHDEMDSQRWQLRLFRRTAFVGGLSVLPLLALLGQPGVAAMTDPWIIGLGNISVLVVAGLLSAGLTGTMVYYRFQKPVKQIMKRQEAVFRPSLSLADATDLDINPQRRYEWMWPARYDDDETKEYALWLEAQFRSYEDLKKNQFNLVNKRAGVSINAGASLGEPMACAFDEDQARH
ncbi:MAG: hypothetical protein AAFR65_16140 [Pseudomonadota bacterium]